MKRDIQILDLPILTKTDHKERPGKFRMVFCTSLYCILIILLTHLFFIDCGFEKRCWISDSSLGIPKLLIYLVIVIPILVQIITKSMTGWVLICTVFIWLTICVGISDYDSAPSASKTGIIEWELQAQNDAIISTIISLFLISVFSILTYPKKILKNNKKHTI